MLRFAPSPTGYLHVGNARIAILNFLFAKKMNLKFILRLDDTDYERSSSKFSEAIKDDLLWLGINYDEVVKQSDRFNLYTENSERLKSIGKVYACYETSEELDLKRKIQLKMGKPPIYDRAALQYTKQEIKNFQREGRKPHWRLKLDDNSIKWKDLVYKDISFKNLSISDPVIIRSDETPLFTLTSVIDDIDLGISHILRGEDHITNTAAQIKLFEYLDADIPSFGHYPLLKNITGEGLSKRKNSLSLKDFRDLGIQPIVLINLLMKLGTSYTFDKVESVDDLKNNFIFEKFSKSSIFFNLEDLRVLNSKFLKKLDVKEIKSIINNDIPSTVWEVIRNNINSIDEILLWLGILKDDFVNKRNEDDIEVLEVAKRCLPKYIDNKTWSSWTKQISEITGKKGKKLYLPLRKNLTGKESGPEMNLILTLLGREKIIKRLK